MLQIKGLQKHYGKVVAVDGLDLEIKKGETVVIMGPSGCGKSTTIHCINRLTEPDAGEIFWNGLSVLDLDETDLRKFRHQVGFVFQQFNLISRLTVLENVMFHLVLAGIPKGQATDQANRLLARVGLKGQGAKLPASLSGGEQQRVGIARALALQPQLMLWDEPTASLDPILIGEVLAVMEDLVQTAKATMVIVTHEVAFALKVADRVVLMNQGKIIEEGPPTKIFSAPESEIGRKYQQLIAG